MLTEDDIIACVCQFLKAHNFEIDTTCTTLQAGDDIAATAPDGTTVKVEAKGETSSKQHTSRFGKAFSSNQVKDHVAKALLRACGGFGKEELWAMAFPSNAPHQNEIQRIRPALVALGVEVFWVQPDRTVGVEGIWKGYFPPHF